jgi:hypothetical protein
VQSRHTRDFLEITAIAVVDLDIVRHLPATAVVVTVHTRHRCDVPLRSTDVDELNSRTCGNVLSPRTNTLVCNARLH